MRRPRGARSQRILSNPVRLALLLVLAGAAFSGVAWLAGLKSDKLEAAGELGRFQTFARRWWGWQPKEEPAWPETVVVYIFSNSDPEYFNNLKFFLKWGVREGDGAYYIIVVQEGGKSPIVDLEEVILPGNARLFHHDAECFDWGTLGWIMSAGMVDVQDYKYFVMVNSGVRGPYAPPYEPVKPGFKKLVGWQREVPAWHARLTAKFDNDTHLVGPTISCEGMHRGGDPAGEWRANPHVQSHAVAVDQVGLRLLLGEGSILKCHADALDARWHAEMGASATVLDAGYNIASLQKRYEKVDWRDRGKWSCNGGQDPFGGGNAGGEAAGAAASGLLLSEALFMPAKEGALQASAALAAEAAAYERWMEGQAGSAAGEDILAGAFGDLDDAKLPAVARMHERGPKCFDFGYYRSLNTDLHQAATATDEQLWGHFLHFGQFERRPFRFTCDWDPPAGHDWAGYPINAGAGLGTLARKNLDPKKQYRAIRPEALPEAELGAEKKPGDYPPDARQSGKRRATVLQSRPQEQGLALGAGGGDGGQGTLAETRRRRRSSRLLEGGTQDQAQLAGEQQGIAVQQGGEQPVQRDGRALQITSNRRDGGGEQTGL